jgi:5-methylcytosine-specific restriction endonuclease McrA
MQQRLPKSPIDIPKLIAKANGRYPCNQTNQWKARQMLKVLERDNFTCQKCGKKELLTIHHKYPVRKIKEDRKSRAYHGRWLDKYLQFAETRCVWCH